MIGKHSCILTVAAAFWSTLTIILKKIANFAQLWLTTRTSICPMDPREIKFPLIQPLEKPLKHPRLPTPTSGEETWTLRQASGAIWYCFRTNYYCNNKMKLIQNASCWIMFSGCVLATLRQAHCCCIIIVKTSSSCVPLPWRISGDSFNA